MTLRNIRIFFILISITLILFVSSYIVVFGRALKQNENHIGIFFALPKIILGAEVSSIDRKTYLTKNTSAFIEYMVKQGFEHIEQLGSGHIFKKGENEYISTSRMYSAHFMIFTYPTTTGILND